MNHVRAQSSHMSWLGGTSTCLANHPRCFRALILTNQTLGLTFPHKPNSCCQRAPRYCSAGRNVSSFVSCPELNWAYQGWCCTFLSLKKFGWVSENRRPQRLRERKFGVGAWRREEETAGSHLQEGVSTEMIKSLVVTCNFMVM